jgi:hypothetical protein
MVPRVEALKLGEGVVAEVPPAVGGPFERGVMKTNEAAVRSFVEVGFDVPIS